MTNWIKTSERLPTEKDTNIESHVIGGTIDEAMTVHWHAVRESPNEWPMWQPFPEPPELGAGNCPWCGEQFTVHTNANKSNFICENEYCEVNTCSYPYDSRAEAIAASRKRHQC